ncbi:hypothetical protein CsSME_00027016 [Camellia sinensis var. sinensis]
MRQRRRGGAVEMELEITVAHWWQRRSASAATLMLILVLGIISEGHFHADSSPVTNSLRSPVPLEQAERPKLKLLPRSKPLEGLEPPGSDSGNRAVERPKLNLKPRSQPLEQSQGNSKNERTTVFGGAQPANRVKQDVPRTETVPTHSTPTRYNEKAENNLLDNRIRKNNDRRDNHVDIESARKEIALWFPDGTVNWQSSLHPWIYE